MTAPTPNAELAYAVLDQIDAHPESWDQLTWDCGTTACFAGWAVRLSGGSSVDGVHVSSGPVELENLRIEFAAYKALGIDEVGASYGNPERTWLFDIENDREKLGELVAEIFGPRPERCGYALAHPAHGWTRLANDEHPDDQPAHCPGVTEERAS